MVKEYAQPAQQAEHTVQIDLVRAGTLTLLLLSSKRLELQEKGFNVRLTIVDTPGFGDYMNNQDCWVPIVDFLDEQHSAYMKRESGKERGAIDDLRVHACLYFIAPTGHTYVLVMSFLQLFH